MIATGSRSLREGAAVAGERSGGGVAPGAGSGIVEPDPDAVSGAGNGRTEAFAGGRFAKHFQQKEADAGFIVEHVAHARPSLPGGVSGAPSCPAIREISGRRRRALSADAQVRGLFGRLKGDRITSNPGYPLGWNSRR
jgi:hypothetical protein